METKICKKCGRELPLDHFAKRHFGISSSCNECNGKPLVWDIKRKRRKKQKPFTSNLKKRGRRGSVSLLLVNLCKNLHQEATKVH